MAIAFDRQTHFLMLTLEFFQKRDLAAQALQDEERVLPKYEAKVHETEVSSFFVSHSAS